MNPILEYKNNKWEVMEDLSFQWFNTDIVVPKGFRTDLASVPRIFWSIYPPFGRYNGACVVHDYLYTTHALARIECDLILRAIMRKNRVSKVTRNIFYIMVRLFGGGHYKKFRKNVN